jgi:hypothetical protein
VEGDEDSLSSADDSNNAGSSTDTDSVTTPVVLDSTPVAIDVVEDEATLAPPTAQPTSQPVKVSCPKGLVNDPYPGKCRRYVDEDGSGYCDFSETSA